MDKYSVSKFVKDSGYVAHYSGKEKMWYVGLFSGSAVKRPLDDVVAFFTANNVPFILL